MIGDIKTKECERISELIELLEQEKAGVEEKYRKLAEEETAKLTTIIDSYRTLLSQWDGDQITFTEKPKRKRRTKAEMEAARAAELAEDEVVVDTDEEVVEDSVGVVDEDNVVTQQELDNRAIQFPDEKITVEVTEDTLPEPVPFEEPIDNEVKPASEDNWETETEAANQEDDNDSWPEFPSEWK